MANSLTLWINPESQRLLANSSSLTSAQRPVFYAGNEVDVELHLISGTGVARIPYEIPFPAGCTIKVSVGGIAKSPTGGDWRLSVSSTETSDLNYNATALEVQTALNALSAVSTDGGVVVESLGGGYSITWNTVGTKPPILAGTDTLTPSAYESIYILQTGDSVTREIVFVELRQSPVSLTDAFTPIAVPVVTATIVQAWNGVNKVVRIATTPAPQNGSYNITVGTHSTSVNAFASAIDIRAALGSAGATSVVTVTQTGNLQFDISLSADDTVTVDGTGLVQSSGYAGTLSFATSELIAFLGNNATADATLEITVEAAGVNTTVCQVPCTVANGVISSGAVSPISIGVLLTESVANARFIRKDTVDAPSVATQDILWQNLGVTTDGSDTVAAINGADSASAGNVFLTVSDGDTRYAAVGSNPFDQDLNTTDSVEFNSITTTGYVFGTSSTGINLVANGAKVNVSDPVAGKVTQYAGTGITFQDATFQDSAFIPADYLSVTDAASTYLTITTAASTYALQSSFDQSLKTTDSPSFVSITAPVSSGGASPVILTSAGITFSDSTQQTTAFINDGTATWSAASIDFIDIFSGTLNITSATGITFPDTTVQNTRVVREQQANGSGFSTGGFDTAHYPFEVKVIDDTGTAYWVPARLA